MVGPARIIHVMPQYYPTPNLGALAGAKSSGIAGTGVITVARLPAD